MRLKKILQISVLKSLYFNLHCFGVKGLGFPVLVSRKCRLKLCGQVQVSDYSLGSVTIGFGGSDGIIDNNYSYFSVSEGATVIFRGKAGISSGSSIRTDYGSLVIGDKFSTNKNCFIACSKGITIGDNVTLGWNVNIRDNDGHTIIDLNTNTVSKSKEVKIGSHVWICAYADLMKGTVIPDDSVVSYRSLVTKAFNGSNILIGGVPAKVLKENIGWKY